MFRFAMILRFFSKKLSNFVNFSAPNKKIDFLQILTFGSNLLSIPLGKAARNHKNSAASLLFQDGQSIDGFKCLLNCLPNKSTGVDNDYFSLLRSRGKGKTALVQVTGDDFTIDQVFSTAKVF